MAALLEAPAGVRELPHDVIGVIMEFLASSALAVHQGAAQVCVRWHEAFEEHEPLWAVLMKQRWPNTRQRSMVRSVYRARVLADHGFSPFPRDKLTEIENCNFSFAFRCPLYAEALKETGELTSSGEPVLFCDVCQNKVYPVTSRVELAERAAQGRCVKFNRSIVQGSLGTTINVCVIGTDPVRTRHFMNTLAQSTVSGEEEEEDGMAGPATFNPMTLCTDLSSSSSIRYRFYPQELAGGGVTGGVRGPEVPASATEEEPRYSYVVADTTISSKQAIVPQFGTLIETGGAGSKRRRYDFCPEINPIARVLPRSLSKPPPVAVVLSDLDEQFCSFGELMGDVLMPEDSAELEDSPSLS